jgi:hypothetical protein
MTDPQGEIVPYPEARPRRAEVLAPFIIGALIISVVASAFIGGSMLRHEASPWIWVQVPVDAARHGRADAGLLAAIYLVFYASAFLVPYFALRVLFWIAFVNGSPANEARLDPGLVRTGLASLSLAVGIGGLFLLRSEIAFARSIPVDVWNGWLFIGCALAIFCLVIGGIAILREQVQQLRVSVPHDAFVACRCKQCGHEWATPANLIGRTWFRDPYASVKHAGGRLIE